MKKPIYLDYAATTPVDARVVAKMQQYLTKDGCFGNPSSTTHAYGWQAAEAVEAARKQVANLIHAEPQDILFTSGATESINLALIGAATFYQRRGKHIVTVKTEHKAGIKTCEYLETQGFEVTYLTPTPGSGLIDLNALEGVLRDDTVLVSIMHVNNEFGAIQDVEAIATLVKKRGAFFHVDAVQSVGKLPIDLSKTPIDLMSFSGHKIYAPKGVGVLYIRQNPRVRLTPQIHGAGQERGLRAGTLAVHQIVAMGEAFDVAGEYLPNAGTFYHRLRKIFLEGLASLDGWQVNGDLTTCLPSIVNVSFEGVDGEQMISNLHEIAVSSGAACTTASLEPSYVLRAIGLSIPLAQSALRVSFGRNTSFEDVQFASELISKVVQALRI